MSIKNIYLSECDLIAVQTKCMYVSGVLVMDGQLTHE